MDTHFIEAEVNMSPLTFYFPHEKTRQTTNSFINFPIFEKMQLPSLSLRYSIETLGFISQFVFFWGEGGRKCLLRQQLLLIDSLFCALNNKRSAVLILEQKEHKRLLILGS